MGVSATPTSTKISHEEVPLTDIEGLSVKQEESDEKAQEIPKKESGDGASPSTGGRSGSRMGGQTHTPHPSKTGSSPPISATTSKDAEAVDHCPLLKWRQETEGGARNRGWFVKRDQLDDFKADVHKITGLSYLVQFQPWGESEPDLVRVKCQGDKQPTKHSDVLEVVLDQSEYWLLKK
jgi:hypothetical protein